MSHQQLHLTAYEKCTDLYLRRRRASARHKNYHWTHLRIWVSAGRTLCCVPSKRWRRCCKDSFYCFGPQSTSRYSTLSTSCPWMITGTGGILFLWWSTTGSLVLRIVNLRLLLLHHDAKLSVIPLYTFVFVDASNSVEVISSHVDLF